MFLSFFPMQDFKISILSAFNLTSVCFIITPLQNGFFELPNRHTHCCIVHLYQQMATHQRMKKDVKPRLCLAAASFPYCVHLHLLYSISHPTISAEISSSYTTAAAAASTQGTALAAIQGSCLPFI